MGSVREYICLRRPYSLMPLLPPQRFYKVALRPDPCIRCVRIRV